MQNIDMALGRVNRVFRPLHPLTRASTRELAFLSFPLFDMDRRQACFVRGAEVTGKDSIRHTLPSVWGSKHVHHIGRIYPPPNRYRAPLTFPVEPGILSITTYSELFRNTLRRYSFGDLRDQVCVPPPYVNDHYLL